MTQQESIEHFKVSHEKLSAQLFASTTHVWETMLNASLETANGCKSTNQPFPWLGSVAWIGGTWTGNIRMGVPVALGSAVTSQLLSIDNPTTKQINDTLREIINMIAGNLKSNLPGKNGLVTPGNFQIVSIDQIKDDFYPVSIQWHKYNGTPFFTAISELVNTNKD
jgi:hypothetical protein